MNEARAVELAETAIIVPVPAAEGVVGQHRRALDHSAAWGVPAHVTVLYPRRFPEHRPYEGAHPDVVPHLTVGSTRRGDLAGLRRAAEDVRATVPISAWIDRVWLIAGTDAPGSWRTVSAVTLRST